MKVLAENEETGCCKRFNPLPWEDKEINLRDKLFVKDHTISLFHIPLNYGKVMKKNMERIEKAGAKAVEPLMLSDEGSLWGSEIYIAVDKELPGSEMVKIPGNYLSKVFEGPYSNMGKWSEEMKKYVEGKGKKLKKLYFFYTTCPACAKAYGKNYTVLLAEI
jgi:effector-binding domain-containing protein